MKLLQRGFEFGVSIDDVHRLLAGLGGFQPSQFTRFQSPPGAAVEPIGVFRGWKVTLCEAAVGRGFPDYQTRRSFRREMDGDSVPHLVVFTDAAHSALVWTWRASQPSGHTRYTEFNATHRARPLRAALAALDDAASPLDGRHGGDDLVMDRLYLTVFPARERAGGGGIDRLQTVLDSIEGFDDPDQVRTLWRRLRSFSVLDEDCSDGARLVNAAVVLEMVFLATLDRMQSVVDDAMMLRHRRRPEHLRDLRVLTERSEDRAWDYDRSRYVRRLIVQQNLFATVSSRVAGRSVLRDLLGYAGAADSGIPLIDCNIWRRRDLAGSAGRAGRNEQFATPPDEEIALHRKAWEMVRSIRLAEGDPEELKGAGCQLHRRRQLLLRQLHELDGDSTHSRRSDELCFLRAPLPRRFPAPPGDRAG